ncbi:hypothetical protein L226DRAFT_68466 [Lentinus tigrinus ALCF2SS1-7]|uniref:uncharacterized protein n=1 Tax=Lentinus tigrinus ALCF2SS1-7 TaxID=1328758 RepID=UPI001165E2F2|nr:hypothetical protein L226DRAFT_68466 [Lentinus tigrinus ALCF2SS1-7]
MSSSHPPQYSSYTLPPPMQDSVRLPSIKDLNFPTPSQDGAPPNSSGRADHQRPRHEPTSWSRSSAPSAPGPPQHSQQHSQQHSPNMPPPHDPPPKTHVHAYPPPHKPDASYAPQGHPSQPPTAGVAPHNGVGAAPPRPENPADASSKRSRSQQGVSASPARSPHTAYPPYPPQPPPPGYHQGPPPAVPPPQEHPQQQPPQFPHQHPPPPGYAPYPPPPVAQRHYANMAPPPPPAHHQPQGPPPQAAYPPPPPEHWQHPSAQAAPPPPPQQQQFNGYARTMPLVPANVEARPSAPSPADAERANRRQHVIAEILKHCSVLYGFAHHYAQLPHVSPAPPEIEEMNHHASAVVHLLEELRRLDMGEEQSRKDAYAATAPPADEHARPPKRPWEDMAREGEQQPPQQGYDAQSTAEADMQIIRNKRQSSTGGAVPGQQKNKYRKRSRATPPGKCHSCNIRETPEWRRGPDGARTLCNACGLHYAKLMRKRDKTLDASGKAPPPIDLQTLRASTASARGATGGAADHGGENSHSQPHPPTPHQAQPPPSPYDQPKQPPAHASAPPPHPGPYQLMPVAGSGPGGPPHQMMAPPHGPGSAPHSAQGAPVPAPPWMSSSGSGERGPYNAEPQSYVRAHPSSHARASPP